MRISTNTRDPLSMRGVNQSPQQSNHALGVGNQKESKDTVSISSKGRANSLVDSLMKQKQSIMESKEKLIGSTLEKGKTLDSIQSLLDSYEEQLLNIDTQISEIMFEQSSLNDSKLKPDDNEPKTKEEVHTERLNSIMSLSGDLSQLTTTSSVKTRMEGQSKVLESEIKLDGDRGGASKSKRAELTELTSTISRLNQSVSETIGEIKENINQFTDIELEDSTIKGESEIKSNVRDNVSSIDYFV